MRQPIEYKTINQKIIVVCKLYVYDITNFSFTYHVQPLERSFISHIFRTSYHDITCNLPYCNKHLTVYNTLKMRIAST